MSIRSKQCFPEACAYASEPARAGAGAGAGAYACVVLPVTVFLLTRTLGRGKSGPLFHFDVHEDVRTVNDARIEKDESHAGKIVERHW